MTFRRPAFDLFCALLLLVFGISTATAAPLSLQIPAHVVGGVTVAGRVQLDHTAPAGGVTVTLTSNQTCAAVPASVKVSARKKEADFQIVTTAVTTNTTVTLTATEGSNTVTSALVVEAPTLSLDVPLHVPGGATALGAVELNIPAPKGGAVVTLASSDPSITVPASVTIPAGRFHVDFKIETTTVNANTTVTLTATDGALTSTANIVVEAQALSIQAPAHIAGGLKAAGVVSLVDPAPTGGAVVTLASSDPSITVPASVTIPAGRLRAEFKIETTTVNAATTVTVAATDGALTSSATVVVDPVALFGIDLREKHVTGGNAVMGLVGLTGPAGTGGVTIQLSSNNTAATVPATVTVEVGHLEATFKVTTTAVSQPVTVTITATANGVSKTVQLTVR